MEEIKDTKKPFRNYLTLRNINAKLLFTAIKWQKFIGSDFLFVPSDMAVLDKLMIKINDLNLLIISSVFAESIARIWYIVDDKKKGEGLNFLAKLWSTKTQTITIRNRIKEFSFLKELTESLF